MTTRISERIVPSDTASRRQSDRARIVRLGIFLGVFAAGWATWRDPVLRFASQPLNIATFGLVLLLATAATVTAFRFRPERPHVHGQELPADVQTFTERHRS